MQFLRQQLIPLIIFLLFFATLVIVSSRAFLPSDLSLPAPVGAIFPGF